MRKDDETVIEIVGKLHETRPEILEKGGMAKEILKLNSKGLVHCFSIVVLQEQERYNKLIKVIQTSLDLLI